ncbi:MAG: ABC-2 transporter permease [Firmicutes bacterium]|nr:ABC-2 transporter permease [Bacillota bacterium]
MKALMNKEFKLVANPLFLLIPLLSALILIPQWVFFVALLYFCFMGAPNLFILAKTYKEVYFSATQPVSRRQIVRARVYTVIILELLQLLVAAVCVAARLLWWRQANFFLDANLAFLGLSFVMFGLFNLIMLPMFYKTAYKIAIPVIVATVSVTLFAGLVEAGVIMVPWIASIFDGIRTTWKHVATLLGGIAIFAALNVAAYRMSAKRFEKLDL